MCACQAGVPVICSDQVGASVIIEKWQCGNIFLNEDVHDLERKLNELLINPGLLINMKLAAIKVGPILEPKIAGSYMFDVISLDTTVVEMKTKLECPWYE